MSLGAGVVEDIGKGFKKIGGVFVDVATDIDRQFTKISTQTKPNKSYRRHNPPNSASNDVLSVFAWNVYLRPRVLFKNGQFIRVKKDFIPKVIGKGYDVLVFSEAFDKHARKDLVQNLMVLGYFFFTSVVGVEGKKNLNGGVIIMSRHPIIKIKEKLFSVCKSTDCLANKGVLYVQILKGNKKYHIFGSHTQAKSGKEYTKIRNKQFGAIRNFIKAQKIPKTEAVIIAGDLNVDMTKDTKAYNQMLKRLHAAQPKLKGHRYSVDSKLIDLKDKKDPQKLLDYTLYSTDHLKPTSSYEYVIPMQSPKLWKEYFHEPFYHSLSDHLPVYGFFNFKRELSRPA